MFVRLFRSQNFSSMLYLTNDRLERELSVFVLYATRPVYDRLIEYFIS